MRWFYKRCSPQRVEVSSMVVLLRATDSSTEYLDMPSEMKAGGGSIHPKTVDTGLRGISIQSLAVGVAG